MPINHQPLHISLMQMIQNPSGSGSAYLAARYRIKQAMSAMYIKVLSKYRKQFYATMEGFYFTLKFLLKHII